MSQTFGSGLKCQSKIHLNTECGADFVHHITTLPNYWMIIMINFQSNKKKFHNKKKEFPNKKRISS